MVSRLVELIQAYSKRQDLADSLTSTIQQLRRAQGRPVEPTTSVCTTARGVRRPRVSNRLSDDDTEQLVAAFVAGTSKRELAERYGISESTVKRLIRKHGASKPSNGVLSGSDAAYSNVTTNTVLPPSVMPASSASIVMGLPKGFVTDLGLPYSAQHRALGNGVVPQQAMEALWELVGTAIKSAEQHEQP